MQCVSHMLLPVEIVTDTQSDINEGTNSHVSTSSSKGIFEEKLVHCQQQVPMETL